MKLPDANVLLYALDERSPRHPAARSWLDDALSGTESIGFAWIVLLAILRITTRPAIFEHPLTAEEAFDVMDGWLAQPCATLVQPTHRHPAILRGLVMPIGTAGNLTNDAHLAALAIEHGGVVCSCDSDFSRFTGVSWLNPIDAS